jgi:hypothetical protein
VDCRPEAQHVLYQDAATRAFSLLRRYYRSGISLWNLWKDSDGRQNAHDAVLRAPLTASVARIHRVDFVECSQNALLEELGGRIGLGVRAASGSATMPSITPSSRQWTASV